MLKAMGFLGILLISNLLLSCSKSADDTELFGVSIGKEFNTSEFEILSKEDAKPFKSWLYGNPYTNYKVKTVPKPEESFNEYTISVTGSGIIFGIYSKKVIGSSDKDSCMRIYNAYASKFEDWFGSPTEVDNKITQLGYITKTWDFNLKPKSYVSIGCYTDSIALSVQNYKLNF